MKKELQELLQKIEGVRVLVVGDLMLDQYIWGDVTRISPEAPVPVVHVKKTEDRLGGAGNVVRNLRCLGAKVSVCGLVGDDKEGRTILQLLERDQVEREGVLIDKARPTTVKTRVIARAQQVVRIDREEQEPLGMPLSEGFSAVVDAHVDLAQVIILSDYGKGAVSSPLMARLVAAQKNGRVGYGKRALVVDPHPANYSIYAGISVAKPSRREAELAAGILIKSKDDALRAGQLLREKWGAEIVIISLGEDGLAIVTPEKYGDSIFLDAVAREVFDVSGAGDTVTAVFAAATAVGASPRLAGHLSNIAAGIVVSEVGTVPVTKEQLREELEKLS